MDLRPACPPLPRPGPAPDGAPPWTAPLDGALNPGRRPGSGRQSAPWTASCARAGGRGATRPAPGPVRRAARTGGVGASRGRALCPQGPRRVLRRSGCRGRARAPVPGTRAQPARSGLRSARAVPGRHAVLNWACCDVRCGRAGDPSRARGTPERSRFRQPGAARPPGSGGRTPSRPAPAAPGRHAARNRACAVRSGQAGGPPRRSRPPGGRGAPGGAGCPCARRVRWRAAVTGGGCPAAAGSREPGGRGPGGRVPALAVTAAGPGLVGRAGARWRVRWWCGCRGRGVRVPGRPGWRGWVRRGRGSRTSGAGPR